jgi:transposase
MATASFDLFRVALGLTGPWEVTGTEFDPAGSRLDVRLDFGRGSRFACPEGDRDDCRVHDTQTKTWRHLDFFQHRAFLHARVPRIVCPTHGVRVVALPWARPSSGFTLLFEALLIEFAHAMPVSKVAKMVREHDTRIWRVIEHYVHTARAGMDYADVSEVGMDETAAARGHDYISVFMDLKKARVLFATVGKDAATVKAFATDVAAHKGNATNIAKVSSDMSPAFISGIGTYLPNAHITFDRFHVIAKLNEGVDAVRRGERHQKPELAKTRYLWLKNQANLTVKQQQELTWLTRPSSRLATARAWRWRQDFQAFYTQNPDEAQAYLRRWCNGAIRSRLEPIKAFVKLVKTHWDGIMAWHQSHISNGLLEGTNSLIQAAKARARGYRNQQKMITIIYLIAGKLPLPTHLN